MSIQEFVTIGRLNNKTIADSEAEVSESKKYALWVEDRTDQCGSEIHFQHLDKELIPSEDEALIETVHSRFFGDELLIGNDGHARVRAKRWVNPDGEVVSAEELMDRLLKVL